MIALFSLKNRQLMKLYTLVESLYTYVHDPASGEPSTILQPFVRLIHEISDQLRFFGIKMILVSQTFINTPLRSFESLTSRTGGLPIYSYYWHTS